MRRARAIQRSTRRIPRAPGGRPPPGSAHSPGRPRRSRRRRHIRASAGHACRCCSRRSRRHGRRPAPAARPVGRGGARGTAGGGRGSAASGRRFRPSPARPRRAGGSAPRSVARASSSGSARRIGGWRAAALLHHRVEGEHLGVPAGIGGGHRRLLGRGAMGPPAAARRNPRATLRDHRCGDRAAGAMLQRTMTTLLPTLGPRGKLRDEALYPSAPRRPRRRPGGADRRAARAATSPRAASRAGCPSSAWTMTASSGVPDIAALRRGARPRRARLSRPRRWSRPWRRSARAAATR